MNLLERLHDYGVNISTDVYICECCGTPFESGEDAYFCAECEVGLDAWLCEIEARIIRIDEIESK